MSDEAGIKHHIAQPVDAGLIALFGGVILLIFNVTCACIFYGKWKKRWHRSRFESLLQGRSAYLSRSKSSPISVKSKYDRLQKSMSTRFRIRSIRKSKRFANSRQRRHEETCLQYKQQSGSTIKSILVQNPRNPGKETQPKKKVTVMEEMCSNTEVHCLSEISHDSNVVKKSLRPAASVRNTTTVGNPNKSEHPPAGNRKLRWSAGRRRNHIPLQDSEIQNYGSKAMNENHHTESDESASIKHLMNSGADPTSENKICTLSTLFITHSNDVLKALSRLEINETN